MKSVLASRRLVFVFAAAALLASLAFETRCLAAEPPRSSNGSAVQQAYQQLLSTPFFAFGGVGVAGTISEGERAFQTIVASTNALELLTAVLAGGNTEAQMYALCGIRKLTPKRFEALAKPIVVANRKVSTLSGCIAMDDRASHVVKHIAAGAYDSLVGNKQPPPAAYQAK